MFHPVCIEQAFCDQIVLLSKYLRVYVPLVQTFVFGVAGLNFSVNFLVVIFGWYIGVKQSVKRFGYWLMISSFERNLSFRLAIFYLMFQCFNLDNILCWFTDLLIFFFKYDSFFLVMVWVFSLSDLLEVFQIFQMLVFLCYMNLFDIW